MYKVKCKENAVPVLILNKNIGPLTAKCHPLFEKKLWYEKNLLSLQ